MASFLIEFKLPKLSCNLCYEAGHKRDNCPYRDDTAPGGQCPPGSAKYHGNMIDNLEAHIQELEKQKLKIDQRILVGDHQILVEYYIIDNKLQETQAQVYGHKSKKEALDAAAVLATASAGASGESAGLVDPAVEDAAGDAAADAAGSSAGATSARKGKGKGKKAAMVAGSSAE
ncbi:Hypothetical protein PENO1_096670 [Penicillium occitanis (nom. inval.)]|nr:hypothetical protein PENOC_111840 [Penicillium occitanis (nom. inval.)]PCG90913.1 Hypothetical protein PENO1_096670 [Penicillium occitanis (nom. inval.)]